MDLNIHVEGQISLLTPALEQLISHIAYPQSPAQPQAAPAATPAAVSSSPAAPVMPAPTAPATSPAMPAPTAPAAAPTAAPAYTTEQIAKAGADLVQAGKMPQLMALLQQYGVQAVTQLRPEQYGEFATALRGLGAQL